MIGALVLAAAVALQAPAPPPSHQAPADTRTINEIRVHGNHSTPDARVLELAAVKPGDPFTEGT
ncbi:MAG TPA: POTRA domain-containing protein, partial [Vicinamibacterales bacterium]